MTSEKPKKKIDMMSEEELDARHAEKMRRKKESRDKIVATKTREKGLLIVHTGKQHVLKRQPTAGRFEISISSRQDRLDIDRLVHRDQLVAHFVVWCMQRNGQMKAGIAVSQFVERRWQPDRRNRNASGADAQSLGIRRQIKCRYQPVDIGQRLAGIQ